MVGYGWIWLDMVGYGWMWLDMVGYPQNPIKSFCISLYTNKYYLTYLFGSREKESSKMYERGGTGSTLLRIHFENMWSWLDLVGYAKFRSFALVVWHRFQQRKLILAKIKKNISNTNTIKTQNRQKQPDKIHQKKQQQKQKTKATKKNNQNLEFDKSWLIILCFASLFFSCVLLFCIF